SGWTGPKPGAASWRERSSSRLASPVRSGCTGMPAGLSAAQSWPSRWRTRMPPLSVLLIRAREIPVPDIGDIAGHRVGDYRVQVGVAPKEARVELLVDPEHVVQHQHLAVHPAARPDADD